MDSAMARNLTGPDDAHFRRRVDRLLELLRRNPAAIRESLQRYHSAFSDPFTPAGNLERHTRTVAIDFVRWTTESNGERRNGRPEEKYEILVFALAQLAMWHELHPDSKLYQRRTTTQIASSGDVEIDEILELCASPAEEDDKPGSENPAAEKRAPPRYSFEPLNRAVAEWFRNETGPESIDVDAATEPSESSHDSLLEAAYSELERRVIDYARSLVRDDGTAKELFQKALVGLAKQYSIGRGVGLGVVGDLLLIMKRRHIDALRRKFGPKKRDVEEDGRATRERELTNHAGLNDFPTRRASAVDVRLEAQDADRELMTHLLEMKPRQRETLIGLFFDMLKPADTPQKVEHVLGISVELPSVYAARETARKALATRLGRPGWPSLKYFRRGPSQD
jgi:DNA-directed RNA polymerase specialized sigma24 family protein